MISIVLPVHNKADMIERVLRGLWTTASDLVTEVIVILDGCTDNSANIVTNLLWYENLYGREFQILYTSDVWEVKACNVGLKIAKQPFVVSIQDDMVITERGWDVRLLKPFLVWNDVFAVTALSAVNLGLEDNHLMWYDAVNDHNSPRNKFVIRDVVNRGPLMLRKSMLEELGYLDEAFAPQGCDDVDICIRAYMQHGWVSGLYPLPAMFDPKDGTTRKDPHSTAVTSKAWIVNTARIVSKYRDFIVQPKHSEDRLLEG